MSRLVRNDAAQQPPQGVRKAKWSPLVVIPSAGHDARAAGTQLANMRRQPGGGRTEAEVRLRYNGCCDEHKGVIKLSTLATAAQLASRTKRLTDHYGHGKLLPEKAHLEWEALDDGSLCSDCLDEWRAKAEKAKGNAA